MQDWFLWQDHSKICALLSINKTLCAPEFSNLKVPEQSNLLRMRSRSCWTSANCVHYSCQMRFACQRCFGASSIASCRITYHSLSASWTSGHDQSRACSTPRCQSFSSHLGSQSMVPCAELLHWQMHQKHRMPFSHLTAAIISLWTGGCRSQETCHNICRITSISRGLQASITGGLLADSTQAGTKVTRYS